MQDLIRRSMRLWQRACRPGAALEEVVRAVEVIPELCSALDAARRQAMAAASVEETGPSEADRLGRYVCHEVRNRLNLVELSLARADARSRGRELQEALEPVRRALRYLAAVADDLRAAAVPPGENGAERAESPRLPLCSVIDDVFVASRDLAEEQGVELLVPAHDDLPDVRVDAARLELVLINLLTNALHHTDDGKPERWVRLEAEALGRDGRDEVGLCVRDNGVGIPAALRPGLFRDPPDDPEGGPPRNGMGLSIVRQAVERSGGRLWLESEEGVGTAVHFTLPTAERATREDGGLVSAPGVRAPGGDTSADKV